MALLLDTCIVYDWLMGEMNDPHWVNCIQTDGAIVSAVAVWEMAYAPQLNPQEHIWDEVKEKEFPNHRIAKILATFSVRERQQQCQRSTKHLKHRLMFARSLRVF